MEQDTKPGVVQLFPKEDKPFVSSNDQIIKLLLDKEDVTWQTVIYELINSNSMDPWDVDISLLTKSFIDTIHSMKEHDLRIPAKMILAAAILLRIKSNKLVGEDLDALDQLLASSEEDDIQGLFDEEVDAKTKLLEIPELIPKSPQPRKRKVSIYDLVYALEKALEVKHRRVTASMPDTGVIMPAKHKDISTVIKGMYLRIIDFFSAHNTPKITFQAIVPAGSSKEDKIYSFIPLMFLDHQKRIYLKQDEAFGDIEIYLRNEELIKQFEMEYEREQEELDKKKKEKAKAKGKASRADARKLKQEKLGKSHRKEQAEFGEKVAKEHEKDEGLHEIYKEKEQEGFEDPVAEEPAIESADETKPEASNNGLINKDNINDIDSIEKKN